MYLQSLEINNFRKFGTANNVIEFVRSDYKKTICEASNEPQSFVACATTLVIGKNNAGKTTVTKALKQVIDKEEIKGTTFNLTYIRKLFDGYKEIYDQSSTENLDTESIKKFNKVELPTMKFKLNIGLDSDPKSVSIQNLSSLIPIQHNAIQDVIVIEVRFSIIEDELYKKSVSKLFAKAFKKNVEAKFSQFLKIIDNTVFSKQIFDIKGQPIKNGLFNINNLFDLKIIKANLDDGETSLSSVFNKIVQYRLKDEDERNRIKLDEEISNINDFIDTHVGYSHKKVVNNVVSKITDKQNMSVNLKSDLDFESLFKKLISYEFQENNNFIPESQFGLGYSNLMKILGQIIDYIEQYEESDTHYKVNLICIEEPENFMHPQMQELFIKNIDDALAVLLNGADKKNINSQLIITTHSSHIVNSKIHSSQKFDNINYITADTDNFSHVITLNDKKVSGDAGDDQKNELMFLKKHIKYKVSELFFADGIILVEGITEEHLLQHYINESEDFRLYGISIFNINGAFAHIYKPIIDLLKIPCLVITDLDIKRSKADKGKDKPIVFKQINKIDDVETTNVVLHKYICNCEKLDDENENEDEDELSSKKLPTQLDYFMEESFKIVFQKEPINGYHASSFEEAYILENYESDTLNRVLKELKPRIYQRIVGKEGVEDRSNSMAKSFEWQCKLASSKSDFANRLLYEIIASNNKEFSLPGYINDGLNWLKGKLDNRLTTEGEG